MTKGHHKTASFTVQPDSIEEQFETKLTALFVKEGNKTKSAASKCRECGLQRPNFTNLSLSRILPISFIV